MKNPRLIYIARFIPFYKEGILRLLSARCDCQFISQDQAFGVGETPELPELKHVKKRTFFSRFDWLPIQGSVSSFRPDVVISELGLSFLPVFFIVFGKMIWGYKVAFWTHGLEGPRKAGRMWASDYLRKFLLDRADAVIYYTAGCARVSHGFLNGPKGYVANNTLDTRKLNQAWERREEQGPAAVSYVVFMGRMVEGKRVLELLDLARKLEEIGSTIVIKLAGTGPLRAPMEAVVERESLRVEFLGAVLDENDKANLLYGALGSVCVGGVGLNVVDSLAFGAPVLTLNDQPLFSSHGPEIEYVAPGICGWRCADLIEMAQRIELLSADAALREAMRASSRRFYLDECSIDRQFKGFTEFLDEAFQ